METLAKICATLVTTTLFCLMSVKMIGAMQQSGYKNKTFTRWIRRGDNLFFNRLCVLSLSLAVCTAITSLCFSFLGEKGALLVSALPFVGFLALFMHVDNKYALKVPYKATGRYVRLFAAYYFITAIVCYFFISLLAFLSNANGSFLYGLLAYVPFAVMPVLLPWLLCFANLFMSAIETARNKRYVKRAGQVLAERKITRIGIVGSYGKTSVKNVLKTLLQEKYAVVATPESYNTPIGIAKTVFSKNFENAEIFIAEMGAKQAGDIAELCALVKPDYGIFTGVCEQHVSTFLSLDNVFAEKSEILRQNIPVVCGERLKARIETLGVGLDGVEYADTSAIQNVKLTATRTQFDMYIGGEKISVDTALLGGAAIENICLAATLAHKIGMTAEEIEQALKNVQPVPHRLQLIESGGVYIIDDGYNCNPVGAAEGVAALSRFSGRKCVVTPGIIECGVLEEQINAELGKTLALAKLDKVILVGETLVSAVKKGYLASGGEEERIETVKSLDETKPLLSKWLQKGDAVLFLNDLPDVY